MIYALRHKGTLLAYGRFDLMWAALIGMLPSATSLPEAIALGYRIEKL